MWTAPSRRPIHHTGEVPVARETAALVLIARRRLLVRVLVFACLLAAGITVAVATSALSARASNQYRELLSSGSRAEGSVRSVEVQRDRRAPDAFNVTVHYFTPDGRNHSLSFQPIDASRYQAGHTVTVYYDSHNTGRARTAWDAPKTAAQNAAAPLLLGSIVIALVGLAHLPRPLVGHRMARGPWGVCGAHVTFAKGRPPLLLVQLDGDPTLFGAKLTGRPPLRAGAYKVRVVGRGPWRVVTAKSGTAVVRAARWRDTAELWRGTVARRAGRQRRSTAH